MTQEQAGRGHDAATVERWLDDEKTIPAPPPLRPVPRAVLLAVRAAGERGCSVGTISAALTDDSTTARKTQEKVDDVIRELGRHGLIRRASGRRWKITPLGESSL